MSDFSNKINIGDEVRTTLADGSGAMNGVIVDASAIGLTIEWKPRVTGGMEFRFIPWSSVANIQKANK